MKGCEENNITEMKKQIIHFGQDPDGDDKTNIEEYD